MKALMSINVFIYRAFLTITGRCFIKKSEIGTKKSLVDSHAIT